MKACATLFVSFVVFISFSPVFCQSRQKIDAEYKQINAGDDPLLTYYLREGWEIVTAAGTGIVMKRSSAHPDFGKQMLNYAPQGRPDESPALELKCKMTLAQAPVIRGLKLGM